jgi:hypothetical protein
MVGDNRMKLKVRVRKMVRNLKKKKEIRNVLAGG